MNTDLTITISVPLQTIAELQSGSALCNCLHGDEIRRTFPKAITEAAMKFPSIALDPPKEPAAFDIVVQCKERSFTMNVTEKTLLESLVSELQALEPELEGSETPLILSHKGVVRYDSRWRSIMAREYESSRTLGMAGITAPTIVQLTQEVKQEES